MSDQPACCDFCKQVTTPLFEGGVWTNPARICGTCAAQAIEGINPQSQPVPEPAPPPERPSKEALLASIPVPRTIVAHQDQDVIGQSIAKRRLTLGVSNHFKAVS